MKEQSRIKQLFCEVANEILEARKRGISISPPIGPISDTLVIRRQFVLYGALARSYYAKVADAASLVTKDQAWSAESAENIFDVHLAPMVNDPIADVNVSREAKALLEDFRATPRMYSRRHSVFGFDSDFDDFEFGLLRIDRQHFIPEKSFGPFLTAGNPLIVHYATVSLTAVDETTATQRAKHVIDKHLAVLNALLSEKSSTTAFLTRSLVGTSDFYMQQELDNDGQWQTFYGSSRVRLPITRSVVNELYGSRAGSKISSLLKSDNTFSERVLAGFEWAGSACIEKTNHTAFLLFAIALEAAVLGRETQAELGHQLASRVAHLSSGSMEAKKKIFAAVKRLYRTRSNIVHTGTRDVTEAQVAEIRRLCLNVLLTLAASPETSGFTQAQHLEEWFEQKLLESVPTAER